MAQDLTRELIETADQLVADGQFTSRDAVFAECVKYLEWRTEQIDEVRQSIRDAIAEADQKGWLTLDEVRESLRKEFEALKSPERERAAS